MLAQGDLAIEVGFENLPRIQEEILELCEAAHTPVIYATQILDNMMKKNIPSPSEVIDASMAQHADCIMLKNGLFAVETIDILGKILNSVRPMFFKGRHLLPNY
ncbi:pyruvate kinase [Campylobacterota bacterium]